MSVPPGARDTFASDTSQRAQVVTLALSFCPFAAHTDEVHCEHVYVTTASMVQVTRG